MICLCVNGLTRFDTWIAHDGGLRGGEISRLTGEAVADDGGDAGEWLFSWPPGPMTKKRNQDVVA